MNIVIFGSPGAGKGTQAEIIANDYGLKHLSSGQLSRQMLNNRLLGKKIKSYMDKGELIPNAIIIKIVKDYIEKNKREKGFIFDGYPRTLGQAKELDRLAKQSKTRIGLVINLKLDQQEALKRILKRSKSSGRSDDNLKTIETRLKVYKKLTEPILGYYKANGILKEVDGRQSITKITKEIKKIIKEVEKKK